MKKTKWYGYLFALIMIFMYVMGIYDFFMMLTHNEAYYLSHNYGPQVIEYFTAYPFYFMIFWIINLLAGLAEPLLFILKKKAAVITALTATLAQFILLVLTFALRNRLAVLGTGVALFDVGILLLTLLFYLYCRRQVLREKA
ncbi:hypothetical protein M2139_001873 [Enterococcus sp. PF1-24]|uniref:hypothetical protein n=1 Tax=unclassified Enterococcus TaxID=2608891 RepID=UPI002473B72C|nr:MULTISPECIES: hypothetical protein [unclassified Enterococcus]MDH6364872.1 hypothetical protein [Enterococcus sp. PFB1-1]MDH6401973.1 hypothetical protein [Enterococcus sp. PF1-24]